MRRWGVIRSWVGGVEGARQRRRAGRYLADSVLVDAMGDDGDRGGVALGVGGFAAGGLRVLAPRPLFVRRRPGLSSRVAARLSRCVMRKLASGTARIIGALALARFGRPGANRGRPQKQRGSRQPSERGCDECDLYTTPRKGRRKLASIVASLRNEKMCAAIGGV